jgi:hypothetical protein
MRRTETNAVPGVTRAHPRGTELTELARQPNDLLALRQRSCGAQMSIMQRDRRIAGAGLSAASASDILRERVLNATRCGVLRAPDWQPARAARISSGVVN